MKRREFLANISALSLLAVLPACSSMSKQGASSHTLAFVSAAKIKTENKENAYAVVGLTVSKKLLWQTDLPERAHAANISPDGKLVVVTGRRPSTHAWLIDSSTGDILHTINSNKNRHFFGHTIFDETGTYLYSTENNTENFEGIISVRAVAEPQHVIKEMASYGVGPHELHFMPNIAKKPTEFETAHILVVANGGIKTKAGSREKLNLDTMQPNLVYIDISTGKLLQKLQPPHNQLSIRHIDVSDNGTVAIALQYQGEKTDNVPLVFTHRLGSPSLKEVTMERDDWHIFNQYIGSVAISADGSVLVATSPRGNCAVLADVSTSKVTQKLALRDCCGVTFTQKSVSNQQNFIISDGVGQTSHLVANNNKAHIDRERESIHDNIQWDNHMTSYFS